MAMFSESKDAEIGAIQTHIERHEAEAHRQLEGITTRLSHLEDSKETHGMSIELMRNELQSLNKTVEQFSSRVQKAILMALVLLASQSIPSIDQITAWIK